MPVKTRCKTASAKVKTEKTIFAITFKLTTKTAIASAIKNIEKIMFKDL